MDNTTTKPTPVTEQPAKPSRGFTFGRVANDGTVIPTPGATKFGLVDDAGNVVPADQPQQAET